MGRHDWYRGPDWDDAARDDFEARLARSRGASSRPQYLRIKAGGLAAAGLLVEATLLLERSIDASGDWVLRSAAVHDLGLLRARQGRLADAARLLRESIALQPYRVDPLLRVELLTVLVAGDRELLAEADTVAAEIEAQSADFVFPATAFNYHVALIRLAERTGRDDIPRLAQAALRIAERGTVFPRHPGVGTVRQDADVMARLRKQAAGRIGITARARRLRGRWRAR